MVYLCARNASEKDEPGAPRRRFRELETWNWPAHSTINVACYANCPEVTLTLNGKVIGTQSRSSATNGVLHWQIPYTPGTLRAVGRENGKDVCAFALQTAGPPDHLHPPRRTHRSGCWGH